MQKITDKRKKDGVSDEDKPQEHMDAETYLQALTKQVQNQTMKSEKALRELIDLGDEMRMQDTILKEVEENIPAAPPMQSARRRRGEDEDESEAPAADPEILSAVELIKKAKADYVTKYQTKSLMQR